MSFIYYSGHKTKKAFREENTKKYTCFKGFQVNVRPTFGVFFSNRENLRLFLFSGKLFLFLPRYDKTRRRELKKGLKGGKIKQYSTKAPLYLQIDTESVRKYAFFVGLIFFCLVLASQANIHERAKQQGQKKRERETTYIPI